MPNNLFEVFATFKYLQMNIPIHKFCQQNLIGVRTFVNLSIKKKKENCKSEQI